jgi:hypothetical protein
VNCEYDVNCGGLAVSDGLDVNSGVMTISRNSDMVNINGAGGLTVSGGQLNANGGLVAENF